MAKNGRKVAAKRKGKARAVSKIPPIPAQPRRLPITFTYNTRFSLTEAAAGTGTTYVFRLNSLYDPNLTGVGSQPVGYDQWSTLFNRSIVTRCDVVVTYTNTTASYTPLRFGFYPATGLSTIPADTDAWATQWGARSGMMGGHGTTIKTLRASFDIHKVLGVTKMRILDDVGYTENTSTAVAGAFQALLVTHIAGVSAVASATLFVTLKFHAVLFDPVALTVS